ncbi:hypothetical protein LQG66_31125 [Bradyrhizobium ontarionense]|uniref:Uncharacterized protein n=1 Tax=Bradyrhizobium ontarionense TaxID=2898149 RepID=A0ABY3R8F3_9BRAD|nr:hypothetical protein [Bradyrhizobium sp. A19]UFZ03624.1 hypothetical protein LQG66_31125 [Bradyrhizobium sp. A19]
MRRLIFIIAAIAILQVAGRVFLPDATTAVASFPPVTGAEFQDHEKYIEDARRSQRKDALRSLDLPWSDRCGANRRSFISGLNHYYYHRQNQHDRYPETYGPAGATYIAGVWTTAEDRRIERLTQEAYAAGYLKPSDFDGMASQMVAAIVRDERIRGRGCAD